ncbi:TLD-domain-containing protein [Tricharina praecox]|uniref:TLD-domain-containing protein n=1 Tax=Tricharina praecox TaxID=43433 RepID=UPI002220841A|nr:TLD-domain-containing protein [Tricharina praecox]KAI5855371.1 TLD-domain-containing protein [Tricharina praecox]
MHPRTQSYSSLPSLPSTLTSALSWTFKALTSPSTSPPLSAPLPAPGAGLAAHTRPSPSPPSLYTPPALPPLPALRLPRDRLLKQALAEEIRLLLPPRLQLHEHWHCVYALDIHGVSLGTLYSRCSGGGGGSGSVGFVLVVRDSLGGIFGAFVNEPLRPRHGYYGTGECFLWKSRLLPSLPSSSHPSSPNTETHLSFQAFPYSGVNDYMILCDWSYVSIGGGDGKYGLWLDSTLEKGVSACCPTFGNEPLSEDVGGKFEVLDVEVWRVGGH